MIERLIEILNKEDDKHPLALHEPCFDGSEYQYIKQCIDSECVSSIGSFVTRFEHKLSTITKAKYVIATINGTAALHTCLLVAGVEPNHEVLTSPLSFIATSNAISYCGAIPHFVDVDNHLNIDPQRLQDYLSAECHFQDDYCINKQTKRVIKALVVTHVFGHPANMDELLELCERYNIELVEDAAQALGSTYKGKPVGHFGVAGAISFNGNKVITTGGGGALLTNSKRIADKAKHLTTTGKVSHPWRYRHDCIAYNYRMPNLNAALGLAQLAHFPTILQQKRKLAEYYIEHFADIADACILKEPRFAHSNYWLNSVILEDGLAELRDHILETLASKHILCRPAWDLHHTLAIYEQCPRANLSNAENLFPRIVSLPSSANLMIKLQAANKERANEDSNHC